MALIFRTATIGDAEPISRLWVRANEARRKDPETQRDDFFTFVLERMQMSDALFLIADDAGSMVGMGHSLTARENDGDGAKILDVVHISMIAVEPSHWGAGIGTLVMTHLINHSMKQGFRTAQLWTAASNERARALYARLGFAQAGREKVDDRGELIVLFRKELIAH